MKASVASLLPPTFLEFQYMTSANEGQPELARVLTLRHLVFYGIVCITPIAALPLFGITQQLSRGHAVMPILLAMVAMMFTAVSYGRMAALFPEAGSAYTYVGRVFHPRLGALTGWLMCLDYGLIPLINVLYAALTLQRLVPAVPVVVWVIGVTLLITALNVRGMQSTSKVNDGLLGLMIVVLMVFVVLAVCKLVGGSGDWSRLFSIQPFFRPGEFQIAAIATATSFAALTYIGFDAISTLAEDAQNPRRDIPLATVLTSLFTGVSGGALVYLSQLLWPEYRHFENVETAFLDVTRYAGGPWLFQAMAVVFLLAAVGSALAGQAGAARLLYAMGREHVVPKSWFGRVETSGRLAPANVVFIGCAAAAGALLVPFERGAELLNFGAFFGFMGVNLAAFRTSWLKAPRHERSLLRDAVVPLAGFVFCLAIFVNLPRPALAAGGVWLASGILFVFFRSRLPRGTSAAPG